MFKDKSPKVPTKYAVLTIVAASGPLILLFSLMIDHWLVRIVGWLAFGLFAIWISIGILVGGFPSQDSPVTDSSDIGQVVTAISDFSSASPSSTGRVSLGGETWDAICEGGNAPRQGDQLVVERREGLKLIVTQRDDSHATG